MLIFVNSMDIKKLDKLIDGKKITKAFLIRKAGITRPTLDAILEGKDFKVSNLERIASALKVPVGYFFDEKEPAPTIVEAVDHSVAATGSISDVKIVDYKELESKVKYLQDLISEKDKRIELLEKLISRLEHN